MGRFNHVFFGDFKDFEQYSKIFIKNFWLWPYLNVIRCVLYFKVYCCGYMVNWFLWILSAWYRSNFIDALIKIVIENVLQLESSHNKFIQSTDCKWNCNILLKTIANRWRWSEIIFAFLFKIRHGDHVIRATQSVVCIWSTQDLLLE